MTVYLVGAGPGDPGLLTLRGAEALRSAEVVVHDRLLDPAILDLTPPEAERIDVGKNPGEQQKQAEINALLVEHGRSERTVVRLKGGDPFVFGRGAEEALALREAGIDYEVIPGITSAVAAPAAAGVPVTHRGMSNGFTVISGHRMSGVADVNWAALAATGTTIVLLMGVTRRAEIAAALIEGGCDPQTPVTSIRWGTHVSQVVHRTTLDALGATPLEPPCTIVIGSVAALDL